MKKILAKFGNVIYSAAALALIVLAWFVTATAVGAEIIVPSVKVTFAEFFSLFGSGLFYQAVANTLLRTLVTFALSLAAAVILSVISVAVPVFGKLFMPVMRFLRAVPTISVILLIIVWLDAKVAPVLVTFLIVFPIMYSSLYDAITGINGDVLKMCKIYKVGRKDMIFSLYVPSVLPTFFDTAKSTVSLTVKVIISAEVLAQTKRSIGIMMQINRAYLETAKLLAWTIVAVIISYLLEVVVDLIRKAVIRWQK
jgi:NitT/TauT family transport system permease protein